MDNKFLCVKMDEDLRVAVASELEKHSWTVENFLNALYRHIVENGIPPNFIMTKSRIKRVKNIDLPPMRTFGNNQQLKDYCDIRKKKREKKVLKRSKK